MEDKTKAVKTYTGGERPWCVTINGNTQCFTTEAKRDEYAEWIEKLTAQQTAKAATRG